MTYAFPADEIKPLSCEPRYRHAGPSRGDLDDVLGRFALTLVDSADTLAVLYNVCASIKALIRDL